MRGCGTGGSRGGIGVGMEGGEKGREGHIFLSENLLSSQFKFLKDMTKSIEQARKLI